MKSVQHENMFAVPVHYLAGGGGGEGGGNILWLQLFRGINSLQAAVELWQSPHSPVMVCEPWPLSLSPPHISRRQKLGEQILYSVLSAVTCTTENIENILSSQHLECLILYFSHRPIAILFKNVIKFIQKCKEKCFTFIICGLFGLF